jgi:hypothetical protein
MVEQAQSIRLSRPRRPLGVSLAIAFAVLLFTVIPLLQLGEVLLIRQHIYGSLTDSGIQPIGVGGEILGVSENTLALRGCVAVAFFVVSILAWRGRPTVTRILFVIGVLGLTGLHFAEILTRSLQQPDFEGGFTSLDSLLRALAAGQFFANLLVLLYVIWYMNRGPARAFYRGYYLPEDTLTKT